MLWVGWRNNDTFLLLHIRGAPFLLLPNSLSILYFLLCQLKYAFLSLLCVLYRLYMGLLLSSPTPPTPRKSTVTTFKRNKGLPLVFNPSVVQLTFIVKLDKRQLIGIWKDTSFNWWLALRLHDNRADIVK